MNEPIETSQAKRIKQTQQSNPTNFNEHNKQINSNKLAKTKQIPTSQPKPIHLNDQDQNKLFQNNETKLINLNWTHSNLIIKATSLSQPTQPNQIKLNRPAQTNNSNQINPNELIQPTTANKQTQIN